MPNEEWKDGLPPVGCECEYQAVAHNSKTEHWFKCTVTYIANNHNEGLIIASCDHLDYEQYLPLDKWKFRPAKAPADIEREEAIKEMVVICAAHPLITGGMETLYDKGYRLQGEEVSGHDVAWGWKDTGNYKLEDYLADHFIITKRIK